MEILVQRFYEKYARTNLQFVRDLMGEIDWNQRLIGIKGSRGVGKTTFLLQYIKKNFKPNSEVLYVTLDNIYFFENKLYDLADEFYKKGGQLLVIDEVHRYKNWSQEIKNIYDDFSDLKVIFTGSSLLHIEHAKGDLSRRAVLYNMPGLSFREFLTIETGITFDKLSLNQILDNHVEPAVKILEKIKPLVYFDKYLQYGYFPYYIEDVKAFNIKLAESINVILDIDIPQFYTMQTSHIAYLKKLLHIIAVSVPFKPNISIISQRTGISVNTLKLYLQYLANAQIIKLLNVPGKGINSINKPEKIYFQNTNLIFALSEQYGDIGNLRETFFINQLGYQHQVNASKHVDFLIDDSFNFEIGGKTKNQKQLEGVENAYLVKDGIEVGNSNVIPLWMFGLLY